jgi:hypothetical protein
MMGAEEPEIPEARRRMVVARDGELWLVEGQNPGCKKERARRMMAAKKEVEFGVRELQYRDCEKGVRYIHPKTLPSIPPGNNTSIPLCMATRDVSRLNTPGWHQYSIRNAPSG